MSAPIVIKEELIFLDLLAESKEDVLSQLSDNLLEQGLVYDTFKDAILEREKVYATGLPSMDFAVAIPHTDSVHVVKDAMSIAILEKPVAFNMMGTADTELAVEMVFLLAIKNPEIQMKMLKSLMDLFQDSEALKKMIKVDSKDEFIKLLKENVAILND